MGVNRKTYYKAEHEAAHSLADLGRYVVAKLLQRRQEALQLAQLPGAASRRELLVGKRSRGRHGRPVAEAIGSGRGAVQGRRRVAASVQHCAHTGRGTAGHFRVNGGEKKSTIVMISVQSLTSAPSCVCMCACVSFLRACMCAPDAPAASAVSQVLPFDPASTHHLLPLYQCIPPQPLGHNYKRNLLKRFQK